MNNLTNHAIVRIRQRGLKESDVDFITRNGSFNSDGYMITGKDCESIIQDAKRLISKASRLKGKFVAADGETIITVFPARKDREKSFVRKCH